MKTHLKKICEEEEGHLVLLAVFDCVDDTKIVEKIIIQVNCDIKSVYARRLRMSLRSTIGMFVSFVGNNSECPTYR